MTWQQLPHFRYRSQDLLNSDVVSSLKSKNVLRGLSYDALLRLSEQRCDLAILCRNKHQQHS